MSENLFTCPCCGYKALDEEPSGTFNICPVCFWEDDNVQFDDPDYEGGANHVSLRQAQRNFVEIGASEERVLQFVTKPEGRFLRDPNWKPVDLLTAEELLRRSRKRHN